MKNQSNQLCHARYEDQWPAGTLAWQEALKSKRTYCDLPAGHGDGHCWRLRRGPVKRLVRYVVTPPASPMRTGIRIIRGRG